MTTTRLDDQALLTTEEAAARLRASVPTLARWRVQGTGPKYIKRAGRVLYREEAIREFEDQSERTSTRDNA